MYLGQEFKIMGNWFIIHFTENNGMAFGMELLQGSAGKLFLSLFRIFAVLGIGVWLYNLIKKKANSKLITSISLIFAGAMGNILDSIYYGKIFSSSEYQIANLFPVEGGYARFLHGKVVDMFYFPIIETHYPQWFPVWGGEDFVFFRPIFNLADASISTGVITILVFQKKFFKQHTDKQSYDTIETGAVVNDDVQVQ